jgi:hypothetical protein
VQLNDPVVIALVPFVNVPVLPIFPEVNDVVVIPVIAVIALIDPVSAIKLVAITDPQETELVPHEIDPEVRDP